MSYTNLIVRASVGYLIGEFTALGIEEAVEWSSDGETTIDLPDHALGVIGATIGIDKNISNIIAKQIRKMFGKSWSDLSKEEWDTFKKEKPNTAEYLREALHI